MQLTDFDEDGAIIISHFEGQGWFLKDFELLEKENYVLLEKSYDAKKKKNEYFVRLAPKGFSSLEEYARSKKQDENNKLLLDATIIAVAGALGVFVNIWNLIIVSENSVSKVFGLAIIGVILASLAGALAARIFSLLFYGADKRKRKIKNGHFFIRDEIWNDLD